MKPPNMAAVFFGRQTGYFRTGWKLIAKTVIVPCVLGRQTGYFRTGWKHFRLIRKSFALKDGRPDTSERDGNREGADKPLLARAGRQTGYFRTGWKHETLPKTLLTAAMDGRPDTSERDGNL